MSASPGNHSGPKGAAVMIRGCMFSGKRESSVKYMVVLLWLRARVTRLNRPHCAPGCASTSVSTRVINSSNSSRDWNRATWCETRCSTRPAHDGGALLGWARNCTTKARLLGSVGRDGVMLIVHPHICGCVGHSRALPVTGGEYRIASLFRNRAHVFICGAVRALRCSNGV